jgi:O-antigen ligase
MFLLAAAVAALLPAWVSLTLVVPTLMALSFSGTLLPLESLGTADVQLYDVVTIVAAFKLVAAVLLQGGRIAVHRAHVALLLFLAVLTAATVVASFRFGLTYFRGELTPLLRFVVQGVAVMLLLSQALQERQFRALRAGLWVLGWLMVVPIFLGVLFFGTRLNVGEVGGREAIRSFGFVGDQVGFVLVLYVLWNVMARRYLQAGVFAVGILATGTRGALISLAVAFLFVILKHREVKRLRVRISTLVAIPLAIVVLVFTTDLGGARRRLLGAEAFGRGTNVHQRLLTNRIAVEVFVRYPLLGVGYTGYREQAMERGARSRFVRGIGRYAPTYTATAGNQYLQTGTDAGVLGLLALGLLFYQLLRALETAALRAEPETAAFLFGGYFWLWGIVVGNQAASWLLPGSFISYLLWICAAVAIVVLRQAPPPPRAAPPRRLDAPEPAAV